MKRRNSQKYLFIVILVAMLPHVQGSGSLYDPPNRAVMWKYGYNTEKNYNYMQLNCGGEKQLEHGPYNCGVCGDPPNGAKEHELGGKYGSVTISRYYPAGIKEMPVKVELLAFEKGFFEFRICAANNNTVTQECLDENLLPIKEGYLAGTPMRFYPKSAGDFRLTIAVPPNLLCERCVLQWRYHTANSWGTSPDTGRQGLGEGPQEEFRNCADIRIGGEIPKSVVENPFFAPPEESPRFVPVDKPTDQRKRLEEHNATVLSIAVTPQNVDRFSSTGSRRLNGAEAIFMESATSGQDSHSGAWVDTAINGVSESNILQSGTGEMVPDVNMLLTGGVIGAEQAGKSGVISETSQTSKHRVGGAISGGKTAGKQTARLEMSTGMTGGDRLNMNDMMVHMNGNFAKDNVLHEGIGNGNQQIVSGIMQTDGSGELSGASGVSIIEGQRLVSGTGVSMMEGRSLVSGAERSSPLGMAGDHSNMVFDNTGSLTISLADIAPDLAGVGAHGQDLQSTLTNAGQTVVKTDVRSAKVVSGGVVGPALKPDRKSGVTVSSAGSSNNLLASGVGKMKSATGSGLTLSGEQTDFHSGGAQLEGRSISSGATGFGSGIIAAGSLSLASGGTDAHKAVAEDATFNVGVFSADKGVLVDQNTLMTSDLHAGIGTADTQTVTGTETIPQDQPSIAISGLSPNTGRQRIFLVRASRPQDRKVGANNMFVSEIHDHDPMVTKLPAVPKSEGMSVSSVGSLTETQTLATGMKDLSGTGPNLIDIKAVDMKASEVIDPLRTQTLTSDGRVMANWKILPAGEAVKTVSATISGGTTVSEIDAFRNELIKGSLKQGDAPVKTVTEADAPVKTVTEATVTEKPSTSKPKEEPAPKSSAVDIATAAIDSTISDLLKEAQQILSGTAELTNPKPAEKPVDTGLTLDLGSLIGVVQGETTAAKTVREKTPGTAKTNATTPSSGNELVSNQLSEKTSINMSKTAGSTAVKVPPLKEIASSSINTISQMMDSSQLNQDISQTPIVTNFIGHISDIDTITDTKAKPTSVDNVGMSGLQAVSPGVDLSRGSSPNIETFTDTKAKTTVIGNMRISEKDNAITSGKSLSGSSVTGITGQANIAGTVQEGSPRIGMEVTRSTMESGTKQRVDMFVPRLDIFSMDNIVEDARIADHTGSLESRGSIPETVAKTTNSEHRGRTNQFRILSPKDFMSMSNTQEAGTGLTFGSAMSATGTGVKVADLTGGEAAGLHLSGAAAGQVLDLGMGLAETSARDQSFTGDSSIGFQGIQTSGQDSVGNSQLNTGIDMVKVETRGGHEVSRGLSLGGQVIDLSSGRPSSAENTADSGLVMGQNRITMGQEGTAGRSFETPSGRMNQGKVLTLSGSSSVQPGSGQQAKFGASQTLEGSGGIATVASHVASGTGVNGDKNVNNIVVGSSGMRENRTGDAVNIEQQINSFSIGSIPYADFLGPGLQMTGDGTLQPGFGPRRTVVAVRSRGVINGGSFEGINGGQRTGTSGGFQGSVNSDRRVRIAGNVEGGANGGSRVGPAGHLEGGGNGGPRVGISGGFEGGVNGGLRRGASGGLAVGVNGATLVGTSGGLEGGINGGLRVGPAGRIEGVVNGDTRVGTAGSFESINGGPRLGTSGSFEGVVNGGTRIGPTGRFEGTVSGGPQLSTGVSLEGGVNGDRRVMSRDDRMLGMIRGGGGSSGFQRRAESGFRVVVDPRTGLEQVIPDSMGQDSRDDAVDSRGRRIDRLIIRRRDGERPLNTDPEYFLDMNSRGGAGKSVVDGGRRGTTVVPRIVERTTTRETTGRDRGARADAIFRETGGSRLDTGGVSVLGRSSGDRTSVDFGSRVSAGDSGLDMGSAFIGGGEFAMEPIVGGPRIVEPADRAARGDFVSDSRRRAETSFVAGVDSRGSGSTVRGGVTDLRRDGRRLDSGARTSRRMEGVGFSGLGGATRSVVSSTGGSLGGGGIGGPDFGGMFSGGFPGVGEFGPFGPGGPGMGMGGGIPPFPSMGFGPGLL